jgi:hypothetical protein
VIAFYLPNAQVVLQSLGASSDKEDTTGLVENTFATSLAFIVEHTDPLREAYEQGVKAGNTILLL